MPDLQMRIQIAQEQKAVAIEIASLGQSPQRFLLSLDELDMLIGTLGEARSRLFEGQPIPDLEGEEVTISTSANTKWYIKAHPPAGALLAFYHLKFGPVGFTLPGDQIATIVKFLTEKFILQPAQSPEKH